MVKLPTTAADQQRSHCPKPSNKDMGSPQVLPHTLTRMCQWHDDRSAEVAALPQPPIIDCSTGRQLQRPI